MSELNPCHPSLTSDSASTRMPFKHSISTTAWPRGKLTSCAASPLPHSCMQVWQTHSFLVFLA